MIVLREDEVGVAGTRQRFRGHGHESAVGKHDGGIEHGSGQQEPAAGQVGVNCEETEQSTGRDYQHE